MTQFLEVVERLNSPIGWFIAFLLTGVPLAIGALRSVLRFHNEFVLHRRAKNIDRALASLAESSTEHALLVESRAQEATLINVGIRLSGTERSIVLQWTQGAPVTLDLIRKAWSQVTWDDGMLFPRLTWYDKLFMWYSVFSFISVFIAAALMFLVVFNQVVLEGKTQLLLVPATLFLMAYIVIKQAEACLSARRLIHRLEQFGWLNKTLQPTEHASGVSGG